MITIRDARISKGWSQDRLGVEAGDIAQNRISQIERGAGVPPKLKEAEAISKALGYPMDELFPMYAANEKAKSYIDPKCLAGRSVKKPDLPVPPLVDKRAENRGVVDIDSAVNHGTATDPVSEFNATLDQLREKTLHVIKCMDRFAQLLAKCSERLEREGKGGLS